MLVLQVRPPRDDAPKERVRIDLPNGREIIIVSKRVDGMNLVGIEAPKEYRINRESFLLGKWVIPNGKNKDKQRDP